MIVFFAGPSRPGLPGFLRACGDRVHEAAAEGAWPSGDDAAELVVVCSATALRSRTAQEWPAGRTAMFVGEWMTAPRDRVPPGIVFIPDELADDLVRGLLEGMAARAPSALELEAARARADRIRRKFEDARDEFIRFSDRVSHDLQSALQNIEGFARVLSERAADRLDPKEAHYLERIRAGALKGGSVVRDAAFMARAAWAPLDRGEVDLAKAAERCISQVGAREGARRIQWDVGDLPRVRGDAAALELALGHLLDNAAKFTRGSEAARVEVRAVHSPGSVELQVRDNGVGFEPGYAQRLFQPFERLHTSTEFEGNGIGLAFVRTVARRHGGDARAELLESGGALFALTLPMDVDAAVPPIRTRQPVQALRILLVDDDPLVLLTIKGMLERDGHAVTAVSGVEVALQELQKRPHGFELVISDWSMPHLGGEHLVRALAQDHPQTSIVILTGRRPDGTQAWPSSVRHVLNKPVRLAELRAALAGMPAAKPGDRAPNEP